MISQTKSNRSSRSSTGHHEQHILSFPILYSSSPPHLSPHISNQDLSTSDLRQVPDHQEVFLSPGSLTSIIFEINSYQSDADINQHHETASQIAQLASTLPPPSSSSSSVSSSSREQNRDTAKGTGANSNETLDRSDVSASLFHLLDSIDPPDYLDTSSLYTTSPSASALNPSVSTYPLTLTTAAIITPPSPPRNHRSTVTHHPSDPPSATTTTTQTTQLLLRLASHATDLIIRINVPLVEVLGDAEKVRDEVERGEEITRNVLASLDVRDWGLFGGEE